MDPTIVPQEFYAQILPSPKLPVLKLIQFHLPLLLPSRTFPATNDFFDTQPPNTSDIAKIQALPSPPQSVVDALKKNLLHTISAGNRSITPAHSISSGTYPLWIITYWDSVFDVRLAQGAWVRAEQNLHELSRKWAAKGKKESANLVEQVFDSLAVLQWGQDLCGFSSNGTDNLEILTAYTSNTWLKGEHAGQMLDLLKTKVQLDRHSTTEIASTWFCEKIKLAYEAPETYTTNSSFRLYHHIGDGLETGRQDQCGFLVNLNWNHWVAVVLDFWTRKIWYGDSLGEQMPETVKKVLEWWTYFHSGEQFTHQQLPVTIQKDSFSCCLLAWDALVVFFSDGKEQLLDAGNVAEGRLNALLKVICRHALAEVMWAYICWNIYTNLGHTSSVRR